MEVQDIEKMLQEEQWTRTAIGAYTLPTFQQLDTMIGKLDEQGQIEVKAFCDKYLIDNAKSIIAMYVSGSILLILHSQEDNLNLLNLIEDFVDIKKWNIVEFLCQKILSQSENRHALRILADCYEQTNREDEKFAIYERLIKADHDEIDIVKQIAQRAIEKGDTAKALAFNKIAFDRNLARHDVSSIRPLFTILLSLNPTDFGYFIGIADKVGSISTATGVAVLRDMESQFKDDIDKRIECEKKILALDKEDALARTNLVASYKIKYKNHSRLKTCLADSTLSSNFSRDILHSIEDFEKNIAFDNGTFVFQESTGKIGRIRSIDDENVLIDFVHQPSKEGTRMSPAMAFKSLKALPKSHIWVLKSVIDKERLVKKVMGDVFWSLNILFTSFDGRCTLKQMKQELTNQLLTNNQWTTWSKSAKELLMNDCHFDISSDDVNTYLLRTTPVSYEEKQLSIFNSHEKFFDKVRDLKKFLSDKGNIDSEFFYEMIKYFSNILESHKNPLVVNSEVVGSFLLLDDLLNKKKMTFIKIPVETSFTNMITKDNEKDIPSLFNLIDDPDLKKCFIDQIVSNQTDWNETLIKLFPYYLTSYIPEIYKSKKKSVEFEKVYVMAVSEFRNYSNMLIYLIKNTTEKTWEKAGISSEKLLFTEIELLDSLNHKIDSKVDAQENGKSAAILMELLFGKKGKENHKSETGLVFQFLEKGKEEDARRIDSLVQSCFQLDPGEKIYIRHIIQTKFSSMKFSDTPKEIDKNNIIPTGWFCTPSSLEAKKKELDHIQHVELPEVSKEIGVAREMGDLRENSEYKYGKEKQQFLNTKMRALADEIDKALVVHHDKIDPSKSGFGTRLLLLDNITKEEISYVIMGPWESDPNKNIINILAPLGMALLNKSKGEHFSFDLNGRFFDYTVKDISVVDYN